MDLSRTELQPREQGWILEIMGGESGGREMSYFAEIPMTVPPASAVAWVACTSRPPRPLCWPVASCLSSEALTSTMCPARTRPALTRPHADISPLPTHLSHLLVLPICSLACVSEETVHSVRAETRASKWIELLTQACEGWETNRAMGM